MINLLIHLADGEHLVMPMTACDDHVLEELEMITDDLNANTFVNIGLGIYRTEDIMAIEVMPTETSVEEFLTENFGEKVVESDN
jgi:hypothetical protein